MTLNVRFGEPRGNWVSKLPGVALYSTCSVGARHDHSTNPELEKMTRQELLEIFRRVSTDIAYFKAQRVDFQARYQRGLITSSIRNKIISECDEALVTDEELLKTIQVFLNLVASPSESSSEPSKKKEATV